MLVLTRRDDERIFIGKDIIITIIRTDRGKVRIGIEAPRDVCILREEVVPRDMSNQPPKE